MLGRLWALNRTQCSFTRTRRSLRPGSIRACTRGGVDRSICRQSWGQGLAIAWMKLRDRCRRRWRGLVSSLAWLEILHPSMRSGHFLAGDGSTEDGGVGVVKALGELDEFSTQP